MGCASQSFPTAATSRQRTQLAIIAHHASAAYQEAIHKLNSSTATAAREDAVKQVRDWAIRRSSGVHKLLINGVQVDRKRDGRPAATFALKWAPVNQNAPSNCVSMVPTTSPVYLALESLKVTD